MVASGPLPAAGAELDDPFGDCLAVGVAAGAELDGGVGAPPPVGLGAGEWLGGGVDVPRPVADADGLAGGDDDGATVVAGADLVGAAAAGAAVVGRIGWWSVTRRGGEARSGLGATVGTGGVTAEGVDAGVADALADGDGAIIAGKFSAAGSADGAGQLSAAVMPAMATTSDAATAIAGRVRQSGERSRRPATSPIGISGAP
jgi:hypothetical protein